MNQPQDDQREFFTRPHQIILKDTYSSTSTSMSQLSRERIARTTIYTNSVREWGAIYEQDLSDDE